MAHGTPDWGGSAPKNTTYRLQDDAELAIRLGSPINFDRRGEVIYYNDFNYGGQNFTATGAGVGNGVALSCSQALSGPNCLMMTPGNLGGDTSRIARVNYYPILGRVGEQISFAPVPGLREVWLTLHVYTGATIYSFLVRYSHIAGTIAVWRGFAGFVVIGTPGISRDTNSSYTTIKLIADLETLSYTRVMINDRTYSAAGIVPWSAVDLTTKSLECFVEVYNNAAGVIAVAVDNWILTQNEPAT